MSRTLDNQDQRVHTTPMSANTTTTHTVAVFSASRGLGWQGQVPTIDLEGLFRYFNRVDEVDVQRLEAIGYDLPSLSADDLIGWVLDNGAVAWSLCAGPHVRALMAVRAVTQYVTAKGGHVTIYTSANIKIVARP